MDAPFAESFEHDVDLDLTPRTAGFACTTLVAEIAAPDPVVPLPFVHHCPVRRIDYIFVRCGDHSAPGGPTLAIRSCHRIFDQPAIWASDRFGVTADLTSPTALVTRRHRRVADSVADVGRTAPMATDEDRSMIGAGHARG